MALRRRSTRPPLVRSRRRYARAAEVSPPPFPSFALRTSRPRPASIAARTLFRTDPARALFAGAAAHSVLPLEWPMSSAIGWAIILAAHGVGWPIAKGGSQAIAQALVSYLTSLGGKISSNVPVRSLNELADADIILCDVTPRQLLALAAGRLPLLLRP